MQRPLHYWTCKHIFPNGEVCGQNNVDFKGDRDRDMECTACRRTRAQVRTHNTRMYYGVGMGGGVGKAIGDVRNGVPGWFQSAPR